MFLAAFVLGPPVGGIVTMGLLQGLPWLASGFSDHVGEFGGNLLSSMLLAVPLSYFVGGGAAIIAGLALAAYVAWGYPLNVWACLVASLIYPLLLLVTGYLAAGGSPETMPAVLTHAAMMAVASVSAALISYLLLRRTALVQRNQF